MGLFCTNCGNELGEGARFCTSCGKGIPVEAPKEAPKEAPAVKPVEAPTENKALRIGLSIVLVIFSFITFMMFFGFFVVHKAISKNYVVETIKEVDVTEMTVGTFSSVFGSEKIDEDSTIAEAVTSIISESFDVDIEKEDLEELLEDEVFSESINEIYGDIIGGALDGQLDIEGITNDLLGFLEDNQELINQVTGENITSEDIEDIKEGVTEVKEGLSELGEFSPVISNISEGVIDLPNSVSEEAKAAKEASKTVNKVIVYMLLALASLLSGLIIFLNRKRLATGFRFVSINLMLVGAIWFGIGSLFRLIPNIVVKVFGQLEDYAYIFGSVTDIVDEIAQKYAFNISDGVRGHATIIFAVGFVILIASIVFTIIDKNKKAAA